MVTTKTNQFRALNVEMASAAPGSELTYTVVPVGTGTRYGVDRDEDGHLDRDELDAGSDPADPDSTPGNIPVHVAAVAEEGHPALPDPHHPGLVGGRLRPSLVRPYRKSPSRSPIDPSLGTISARSGFSIPTTAAATTRIRVG